MTEAAKELIWLCACAVNGAAPDAERAGRIDITALYKTAEAHMLTAIAAMALEDAGIRDPAFTEAKGKAIRKIAAADPELLEYFSASGVYGTRQHARVNHIRRELEDCGGVRAGRGKYILRRLFLPTEVITKAYPFLDRHTLLIPFFSIWRPFRHPRLLKPKRTVCLSRYTVRFLPNDYSALQPPSTPRI